MLSLDLRRDPEEAANTVTHGVGAVSSSLAGTALVALTAVHGNAWQLVGAVVYSFALILLYTASTLYHWEQDAQIKRRFEILDHCAIYIMIAGTYTPFMLVTLHDWLGWTMLAVIWSLAVAGVIFKLIFATRFLLASTLVYIAMGWLIIVAAGPLLHALTPLASLLLMVGGLAYTAGTYFFHHERLPYTHAIWHLFVLTGSACHFFAVATQVLPA